jgi:hypothetical protein
MESEMKKIVLPQHMRIVVTGFGRVGNGAEEILKMLPITRVEEEDFFSHEIRSSCVCAPGYARVLCAQRFWWL